MARVLPAEVSRGHPPLVYGRPGCAKADASPCQGSLFQLRLLVPGPVLLLCALSWNMNESIEKPLAACLCNLWVRLVGDFLVAHPSCVTLYQLHNHSEPWG